MPPIPKDPKHLAAFFAEVDERIGAVFYFRCSERAMQTIPLVEPAIYAAMQSGMGVGEGTVEAIRITSPNP